jgi:hypothetical protein
VLRTSLNGDSALPAASELSLSILTLWPMYMGRSVCESVQIWLYSWILHSDPCHERRLQGEAETSVRILGAETVLTCSLRLSQADPSRSSRARAEMDGYKMIFQSWKVVGMESVTCDLNESSDRPSWIRNLKHIYFRNYIFICGNGIWKMRSILSRIGMLLHYNHKGVAP